MKEKKNQLKKKLVHAFHQQRISFGLLDMHVIIVFTGHSHESYSIVLTKVQANLKITEVSIEATIQTGASKYTKPRLSKSLLWQFTTSYRY